MFSIRTLFGLFLLLGLVSTSFIACHHDPGHITPGQDPLDSASGCANNEGAEWVNQPTDRNGRVEVRWTQGSIDPSVKRVDFVSFHPFIGTRSGTINEIGDITVNRHSGNMKMQFCCGQDKVIYGQTFSQGAVSEFGFDGSSSIESVAFGSIGLINPHSWTMLRCQDSFDSYENIPVDFPISVLTICLDSQDQNYEVETTFTYRTTASCDSLTN